MPKFDEADWQLTVGGLVDRPSTFRYDELLALPKVEQVSTFHCVTGWSVKNVHWGGVRLRDVLAQAAPRSAGARAALRLGGEAVRRLPHARAGRADTT